MNSTARTGPRGMVVVIPTPVDLNFVVKTKSQNMKVGPSKQGIPEVYPFKKKLCLYRHIGEYSLCPFNRYVSLSVVSSIKYKRDTIKC